MSIYFYGCMSLDGYLADADHNLDWLYQLSSTAVASYDPFYAAMDITIMGKKTFQEIEPVENIAVLYATTTNYVFTHDNHLSNDAFIPVSGDIVSFVKTLDPQKNIWIVGGNTILAPLLDHDMMDHMIVQIAPVLLGSGIPLFTQKERLLTFNLDVIKQYGPFAELVFSKK